MRINAMARHFMLEAMTRAAQSARPEDGELLEKGAPFSPGEFLVFKRALARLVEREMVSLEERGVLASGNLMPHGLDEAA